MDYTILINKENCLDSNYIPKNLIVTDENENNFHNYMDPTLKPMLDAFVFSYFLKMAKVAKQAGFHIIVDSGYRSFEYQQSVWDYYLEEIGLEETKKRVAPPGASEHQCGLAFDVAYITDGNYGDSITDEQEETKWMFANAHKYGFILRYPKGKEDITGYNYEPWHYRFVGVELASYLFENDITLEEYYLKNKEKVR
ncbi:MAG: D-alanyl-D-alanine carboxypeptidase family protein [Firmicutes bacterium]|nr:D-alanyl-D-alanine carboxypeptidase family protein [Bacillota bacterium]